MVPIAAGFRSAEEMSLLLKPCKENPGISVQLPCSREAWPALIPALTESSLLPFPDPNGTSLNKNENLYFYVRLQVTEEGFRVSYKVTQIQEGLAPKQPLIESATFSRAQNTILCLASKEPSVNFNAWKWQISDSAHQRTFISVFHNFFNNGKLLTSRDFLSFSFSFDMVFFFSYFFILMEKHVSLLFL